MSQHKRTVSIIVLAEGAPVEIVNDALTNVTSQTHKNVDIIVSHFKRDDIDSLKARWNSNINIRWVECEPKEFDLLTVPEKMAVGEVIFYKSMNPTFWLPRHIEHHLDLYKWNPKAEWAFSYVENRNFAEKDQPINVMGWKIEKAPAPDQTPIEELSHLSALKPDWAKCVRSPDGKNGVFIPGFVIEQWRNHRCASPTEITVQQWIDPRRQQPQVKLGQPASSDNVNEEVVEVNGDLTVKVEYPTIVGSDEFREHNNLIYDRISSVDPLTVQKIAVKRTIGMGDVIMVEPVLRHLRTKYPNSEITLFTAKSRGCSEIVKYFATQPNIVVEIDENHLTSDFLYTQKGYDLRFDLDLSYESRVNIPYIDAYFRTAGFRDEVVTTESGQIQLSTPIPDNEKVPSLIYNEPADDEFMNEKYVAVELAGSGWGGKEWGIDKWKEILARLVKDGYSIAFLSSQRVINPDDQWWKTLPEVKVAYNNSNDFGRMMKLIRYSQCFVGADNGPMHVASSLGIRCFVVAGAALPKYTTKNPLVFESSKKELGCLHCKGRQYYNDNGQGGITFVAKCENSNQYACMKDLSTQEVMNDFETWIAKE